MRVSGSFGYTLDEKNRIRIPKKLRDKFPDREGLAEDDLPDDKKKGKDEKRDYSSKGKICLVRYLNGCLAVFPEEVFNERLGGELLNIRTTEPKRMDDKRQIMRNIEWVDEDSQGRFTLSPAMRRYAGIGKEVEIIGMVDYLEIWSPDRLDGAPFEMTAADKLLQQALLNVAL